MQPLHEDVRQVVQDVFQSHVALGYDSTDRVATLQTNSKYCLRADYRRMARCRGSSTRPSVWHAVPPPSVFDTPLDQVSPADIHDALAETDINMIGGNIKSLSPSSLVSRLPTVTVWPATLVSLPGASVGNSRISRRESDRLDDSASGEDAAAAEPPGRAKCIATALMR